MKRALIVATVGGFLSQFEMNDVKILKEKGYEVHYAANLKNNMYQIDCEKLQQNHVFLHDIHIEKSPLKLHKHWKVCEQLKKLIEELQIDLLHCHTPAGGVVARVAAHLSKREVYVIYTAHGFHFYKGAAIGNWMYYPIEKILARITDCLVTINKEDFQRAKRFQYKKNGYAIQIPGVGIDLQHFYPRPEMRDKMRNELKIPKEGLHVITIGEINRNKNLEVAIKSLGRLKNPDIYYSIFGRGKSVEYIKSVIEKSEIRENIRYLGYCNEPENVLQSADVFLFPSIREGLGMAALEALACGVPVIALDNRGTREYMQNEVNGFVCNYNLADEFAEKLERAYGMYKNKTLKTFFHDTCVRSVKKFETCETEKIMREVYERADR